MQLSRTQRLCIGLFLVVAVAHACHDFVVSHYEPVLDLHIEANRSRVSFRAFGREWALHLTLSDVVEGNRNHFHGQLEGDPTAIVSLSLLPGQQSLVMGMVMTSNETYWIENKHHDAFDGSLYIYRQSDVTFNSSGCANHFSTVWSADVVGDYQSRGRDRRSISSYSAAVFVDQRWANPSANPWASETSTLALFNDVNAVYAAAGLGQFRVTLVGTLNNNGLTATDQMLYYFSQHQTGFSSSYTNSVWLVGSNVGGIAWIGSTCRQQPPQYRTAVAGLASGSRLVTVKTISHELGHNRGAPHDFANQCMGSISAGCQCSVMSYCARSPVNYFSQSSIDAMRSAGCL